MSVATDTPKIHGRENDASSMGDELVVSRSRSAWKRTKRLRSIIVTAVAVASVLFCVLWIVAPPESVPKPFAFDPAASWITKNGSQQSMACFRLDLDIPSKIENAWLAIASNGGYEVLTNGVQSAHLYLLSPTHPFQDGLSEFGQRFNARAPAVAVDFPREYEWHHHDNAELPTKVNLTSTLHPGHNALCVQVETNGTQPAMILSGEILLATGERIPIRSDTGWRAASVPQRIPQDRWTLPNFPVSDWDRAEALSWKRSFWTLVPDGVYETPFVGRIINPPLNDSVTWVEQEFDITKPVSDAFLRIVSDTPYQIWINGRYVRPPIRADGVLAFGPWFLREVVRNPIDYKLENQGDSLDGNFVDTLLPGQPKEQPVNRDPVVNNFVPDQVMTRGTSTQPYAPGLLPPSNSTQNNLPRGTTPDTNPQTPETVTQPSLNKDRRTAEFCAYGVGPLLHKGRNTLRIGLYKRDLAVFGQSRQPFIAFDGAVNSSDGSRVNFASDHGAHCYTVDAATGRTLSLSPDVGQVIEPHFLPPKSIFQEISPDKPWGWVSLGAFVTCALGLLLLTKIATGLRELIEGLQWPSTILASWICGALLVRSAMLERSDALYWRFPAFWAVLLAAGILIAIAAWAGQNWRLFAEQLPTIGEWKRGSNRWVWLLVFGFAIATCFALRAWRIDVQAPDADEYTSLQAVLSITKHGVPEYQPGIWYTRSALYHYLAAGVALLTGSNLYTLRLLSVFFACATAALVWKMTEELTRNRIYALAATLLFSIEPYLVYTGHVARFYQQHQFFNLLGLYLFIRGFVLNTGMRDRYLAVATFLAGVLSQEITVLQAIPLGICYVLFGRNRRWPDEIRILWASACAACFVFLDVAFHLIKCLTPLEGVSPRVEAKVGWSVEKIVNFFTLFVSYSRLHLFLSVFLIPGFVQALRRKQTVATCQYIYLLASLITINLLITSKGYRYQYYLIPLWIILSIHGVAECVRWLIPAWKARPARLFLASAWSILAICSFAPWRMLNSYDASLGGNTVQPLAYVRQNFRSGDKLAITEPYPDAAYVETGRCDYDISIPILYDFSYRRAGRLVDRNGGGEVIGSLDDLQRAIAKPNRLWIVFDRYTLRARGQPVAWLYPAGRLQLYLQNNCKLVFRSYLWSVYLWDKQAGRYSTFREKPGDWFE
ncbi:MAG: glycosyltransferase family 39 protein [Chthoniobacterales bacterium]